MKKTIFILILILSARTSDSQPLWTILNPLHYTYDLYSVFTVSEDTAFACGVQGKILRTTNGVYWELLNSNVGSDLNSIFFMNPSIGWAVGTNGAIIKTTNSGESWFQQVSNNSGILESVFFLDSQTGWVSVTNNGCISTGVLKTTNGGGLWQFIPISSFGCLSKIQFTDYNTGWFQSNSGILKTTNGGINWNISLGNGAGVSNPYFISNNIGWASAGYPFVFYGTTNGGFNWVALNTTANVENLYFSSPDTGWGITGFSRNSLCRTTNGGVNWSISFTNQTTLKDISFLNGNTGYAVGLTGAILKTNNAGQNWTNFAASSLTNNLKSVYFIDSVKGFIVGDIVNQANMLKSTNGGYSWVNVLNNNPFLTSVRFSSAYTGWATTAEGSYGKVYKSTDSGENWNLVRSGLEDFYDCVFLNDMTGFVCGEWTSAPVFHPLIIKTNDGGISWTDHQLNNSAKLKSMCILDSNRLVAVGDAGFICRSGDFGNSWQTVSTNTPYNFSKVFSLRGSNNNTCWAVNSHEIFVSTDAGSSWTSQLMYSGLNSIIFTSPQNGWVIGNAGSMLYTVNGGVNWYTYNSPTNLDIVDIFFINPNTGWAVGSNGLVLKTNSGGFIPVENYTSQIPNNFSLRQNYPNPFNPSTKIKFEVPLTKGGDGGLSVKLIIYDILGREVTILVNEQLKPGSYDAEWDGSNYASGIYFYRLQTEQFAETKKMVLMK